MATQRASLLVLALLLGLSGAAAIPALLHLQQQAKRNETMQRLGTTTLALHACNNVHGCLPPACDEFGRLDQPASVHVHLLPFVGEGALFRTFLGARDGNSEAEVAVYRSPLDYTTEKREGVQNFAANLRVFSARGLATPAERDMDPPSDVMPGQARIPRTFVDGLSNTLVLATKLAVCGDGGSRYAAHPALPHAAFFGQQAGTAPADSSSPGAIFQVMPREPNCICMPGMAQTYDAHGLLVGSADGSVRTVTNLTAVRAWNLSLQPNDGLVLGNPDVFDLFEISTP